MSTTKKWEIKELEKQKSFCKAGKIILKSRIDYLLTSIDNYFKERSVENLHNIRIALRRVRYNMELFISCYERKLFLRFYKGNIKSLIEVEKVKINRSLLKKVDERRHNLENNLEIELMKFLHSKTLKDFYKLLD